MKVAILGTGPGAMFSIMACNDLGIEPYTADMSKVKAPAGAFYYHWIPERYRSLCKVYPIQYKYLGDEAGYIHKQWGDWISTGSSFGGYKLHEGFSPAEVHRAFLADAEYIPQDFPKDILDNYVLRVCRDYDIVFCTFMLDRVKKLVNPIFRPVETEFISDASPNKITYNGSSDTKWIRQSALFGMLYTEYPRFVDLPGKPGKLSTIMDLHPSARFPKLELPRNLHMVGRFAQVDRRLLAHCAYNRVKEILDAS
jgi:hypothetical protein